MTIEELKALLESGSITQEEFDKKVKELEEKKGDDDKDSFNVEDFLKSEDFQKLLQSEVDKVRTRYSQEKKTLESQLDDLRKKNMTKEDILSERENSLKDYELKLKQRELEFETLKILEEKKLPSSLLNFVVAGAEDSETVKEKIDSLSNIVNETATQLSEEKFKGQGRDLEKGKGGDVKKWEEMTIDEQIKFVEENPAEAEKYL